MRRILLVCALAFCAVSIWIVIAFPGHRLDLWFYFAYMTVACTFIPLQTPPLAMAYGQKYSPFLTAALGGIGSCISGLIDYVVVTVAFRNDRLARIKTTRMYHYVERVFRKCPFIVLVIAAFTPIPFEPVRVLACATEYNKVKYVLAIFVGRAPRYFLLGMLQREVLAIPNVYLYGSIPVLMAIWVLWRLLKRLRTNIQLKEE